MIRSLLPSQYKTAEELEDRELHVVIMHSYLSPTSHLLFFHRRRGREPEPETYLNSHERVAIPFHSNLMIIMTALFLSEVMEETKNTFVRLGFKSKIANP